jgi:epsilon-lactone hydrolase
MASPENAKVKELFENFVTAVTPTDDYQPGIPEFREEFDAMWAHLPVPDDAQITPTTIGGVPGLEVRHPDTSGDDVVLWFHGGAFVIGKSENYRSFGYELSKVTGARVLIPDYRLAPEDPYPAANDDAVAAYQGLLDEGLQPTQITVGGDSAGGGLAAALLVRLKNEGITQPGRAVLASPWCDQTNSSPSVTANAERDPVLSGEMLGVLGSLYLGDQNDPKDPLISAVHADLSGLPPLLIFVGTEEALLDDSVKLADNAKQAGVDATLVLTEGMYHVYPCFAAILPEAAEALEQAAQFIKGAAHQTAA